MVARDAIRKAARGQPCTLRLDPFCDGGGETTVLAHVARCGNSGMGMKPPDVSACFACGPCHAILDQRDSTVRANDSDILEAILRTHDALRRMGLVQ